MAVKPVSQISAATTYQLWEWGAATESDTLAELVLPQAPKALTLEVTGTSGGATFTVNGGLHVGAAAPLNALKDGAAISEALSGTNEVVISVLDIVTHITPVLTGGTSQSETVRLLVTL